MVVFGSQNNTLALDSSDMDVAVLGLAITNREEIVDCMYEMLDTLLESQFVETVKIID